MRYSIHEFGIVIGLKCSKSGWNDDHTKHKGRTKGKAKTFAVVVKLWNKLCGNEPNPTTSWILDKLLMGKKYKDPVTRFHFALLLLVDGVLCPTCQSTNITNEWVAMLLDIDAFLKYPWGRELFHMTITSAKSREALHLTQQTTTIQGFSHAIVLVAICACPKIVHHALGVGSVEIEDIISSVVSSRLVIIVAKARTIDKRVQVPINHICCYPTVDHMASLIEDDYPFELNGWRRGVKAEDVVVTRRKRKPTENNKEDVPTCEAATEDEQR